VGTPFPKKLRETGAFSLPEIWRRGHAGFAGFQLRFVSAVPCRGCTCRCREGTVAGDGECSGRRMALPMHAGCFRPGFQRSKAYERSVWRAEHPVDDLVARFQPVCSDQRMSFMARGGASTAVPSPWSIEPKRVDRQGVWERCDIHGRGDARGS